MLSPEWQGVVKDAERVRDAQALPGGYAPRGLHEPTRLSDSERALLEAMVNVPQDPGRYVNGVDGGKRTAWGKVLALIDLYPVVDQALLNRAKQAHARGTESTIVLEDDDAERICLRIGRFPEDNAVDYATALDLTRDQVRYVLKAVIVDETCTLGVPRGIVEFARLRYKSLTPMQVYERWKRSLPSSKEGRELNPEGFEAWLGSLPQSKEGRELNPEGFEAWLVNNPVTVVGRAASPEALAVEDAVAKLLSATALLKWQDPEYSMSENKTARQVYRAVAVETAFFVLGYEPRTISFFILMVDIPLSNIAGDDRTPYSCRRKRLDDVLAYHDVVVDTTLEQPMPGGAGIVPYSHKREDASQCDCLYIVDHLVKMAAGPEAARARATFYALVGIKLPGGPNGEVRFQGET